VIAVGEVKEPSARYLETLQPTLFRQFCLLSTASAGVARLRELILTLGLQGKLVTQDPNDEPASILIERIGSLQRGRSARRGRNETGDADIAEDESPFSLPLGWQWTRLGSIFTLLYGSALPEQNRLPGSIPVYGSNGQVGTHREALVLAPSLVIGRKGSVGAVNVTNGPFWPIDTSYFVTPPDGVHLQYAYWLFRSLRLGKHDKATAIPGISRNDVYVERIALPPYAEQARIVARVDELMRLCDALEEKGRLEAEQHARLLSTLLGTLTDSATPEGLVANWQRVAEHFDLLLDRPEAVDALEQAVLDLAFQGLLLTPGTAEARENQRTDSATSELEQESRWTQTTLAKVCLQITDGEHATPERCEDRSQVPLVTAKNVRSEVMDFSNTDFVPVAVAERCWRRCRPTSGDILMVSVGATLGRLSVLSDSVNMVLVRSVTLIRPDPERIDASYLALHLMSPSTQRDIWGSVKQSAQPCLYLSKTSALSVSFPGLGEQRRIVARVTELRRLCATLRERLQTQQATQSRLAEALVEQALA
jgi:type I restriction enzyme S subunit